MNHYFNFTLISEDGRSHVLLPWQNVYSVGFNAIDTHLQTVVPEPLFDRTRQLKVSEHQPELNSSQEKSIASPLSLTRKTQRRRPPNARSGLVATASIEVSDMLRTINQKPSR